MKSILLLAAIIALGTGCASISTSISVNPNTGVVSYHSPKNVKFDNLSVSRDSNGAVSVTVSNLATVNDPDVIAAKGTADANTVNALGFQLRGAVQDGINAYATYASGGAVRPQISAPSTNAIAK